MAGVLKKGIGSFGKAARTAPGVTAWKVPRPAAVELPRMRPIERAQIKDSGPFFIGRMKASDLEWRVYRMLLQLGWPPDRIRFQVDILGGRKPGGQVLDFVVDGGAVFYVIWVNGDYWHKFGPKQNEAKEAMQAVSAEWPSAHLVALYSGDLVDDEMAMMNLARTVGRGM
jgi:hypothetical protein